MTEVDPYYYDENDWHIHDVAWSTSGEQAKSKFDRFLLNRWRSAMDAGYFRYTLDGIKFKKLPGPIGYLLQLNHKRANLRRKPQFISSMNMPYDPQNFNFMKVPAREIICNLVPNTSAWDLCPPLNSSPNSVNQCQININGVVSSSLNNTTTCDKDMSNCNNESDNGRVARHLIIINESPFHEGHVLLVPDIDFGLNQHLTERALLLSVEVMLISAHPGFRIAFNSLCAYASVNHLHLHGWYIDQPFYIERAAVKLVCDNCWETVEMPCKAFVFQLAGLTVYHLVRKVFLAIDFMQKNEIAYNLFMIRGPVCGLLENKASSTFVSENTTSSTLKIYIWPRKKVTGMKNEHTVKFYPAVAELSGDVMVYQDDAFESLTTADIDYELANSVPEEFSLIRDFIISVMPL